VGTAAKLNSENQNNAATLQIAEIPEKVPQESGITENKKKGAADIKNIGCNG
jgi:hypothetical protein